METVKDKETGCKTEKRERKAEKEKEKERNMLTEKKY